MTGSASASRSHRCSIIARQEARSSGGSASGTAPARPFQAALNSGREVSTASTGMRAMQSFNRSRNSSVDWSAHCRSSYTATTICRRERPATKASKTSKIRALSRRGISLSWLCSSGASTPSSLASKTAPSRGSSIPVRAGFSSASSLARRSLAPSSRRKPADCCSRETSGCNGLAAYSGEQRCHRTVCGYAACRSHSSRTIRDLPIPVSPETSATRPRPPAAVRHARSKTRSSAARPTNGAERSRCRVSSAREAGTGCRMLPTGIRPEWPHGRAGLPGRRSARSFGTATPFSSGLRCSGRSSQFADLSPSRVSKSINSSRNLSPVLPYPSFRSQARTFNGCTFNVGPGGAYPRHNHS